MFVCIHTGLPIALHTVPLNQFTHRRRSQQLSIYLHAFWNCIYLFHQGWQEMDNPDSDPPPRRLNCDITLPYLHTREGGLPWLVELGPFRTIPAWVQPSMPLLPPLPQPGGKKDKHKTHLRRGEVKQERVPSCIGTHGQEDISRDWEGTQLYHYARRCGLWNGGILWNETTTAIWPAAWNLIMDHLHSGHQDMRGRFIATPANMKKYTGGGVSPTHRDVSQHGMKGLHTASRNLVRRKLTGRKALSGPSWQTNILLPLPRLPAAAPLCMPPRVEENCCASTNRLYLKENTAGRKARLTAGHKTGLKGTLGRRGSFLLKGRICLLEGDLPYEGRRIFHLCYTRMDASLPARPRWGQAIPVRTAARATVNHASSLAEGAYENTHADLHAVPRHALS